MHPHRPSIPYIPIHDLMTPADRSGDGLPLRIPERRRGTPPIPTKDQRKARSREIRQKL